MVIFCNGNAGYSDITEKSYIVEKRKEETRAAYERLGVEKKTFSILTSPIFLFSLCHPHRRRRTQRHP